MFLKNQEILFPTPTSFSQFFDKRYYTQILLFCNKLLNRPKAAEVLYAHIIKLPKAQTVLTDENFSRIVYLSRNILRVIPKEKKEKFQSALKLFVPDESITTGVFSEHLPKFNTLNSAMETCLEFGNKHRFGTALRRHVMTSAKRLKMVSFWSNFDVVKELHSIVANH